MTATEVLKRMEALLRTGFTNSGPAKGMTGRRVEARSIEAISWSLFGALAAIEPPFSPNWEKVVYILAEAGGHKSPLELFDWSESPARQAKDVLEVVLVAYRRLQ